MLECYFSKIQLLDVWALVIEGFIRENTQQLTGAVSACRNLC